MRKKKQEPNGEDPAKAMILVSFAMSKVDKEVVNRLARESERSFAAQCRRILHHVVSDRNLCAAL